MAGRKIREVLQEGEEPSDQMVLKMLLMAIKVTGPAALVSCRGALAAPYIAGPRELGLNAAGHSLPFPDDLLANARMHSETR